MVSKITKAGVYDLPPDVYHRDPVEGGSLTSSGARALLDMPPARWHYERTHPAASSPAQILGTAVHTLALGTGSPVVKVDADDWRTKAAKEKRDETLAAGGVPLLRDDYAEARAMADAVLSHSIARHLFTPDRGKPEQTLVWRDEEFGIWRRSMVDHLPHPDARLRPFLVDLKSTRDASPKALGKAMANYGYHIQERFYLDGYEALFPGTEPAFLFVFVESTPPYLVSVAQLDEAAQWVARGQIRRAMGVYAECTLTGSWPGYPPEIETVSLPPWALRVDEEVTW